MAGHLIVRSFFDEGRFPMTETKLLTESRFTRQIVLPVVSLVLAAVVVGSVLAQEPTQQAPRVKGPLVWLDMDQKEIDDAYDQSVWAPNQQHVSKRRAVWSESVHARLKPERVAYGPTEIEKFDIYKTKEPMLPSGFSCTAARGSAARPRTPRIQLRCS